jgi:signal peptidase I
VAAIILMADIGAWAVGTDRLSYVVTYGVSMNPVYYQNDLVFVLKTDSYQVGQIAAYHGSSSGPEVLHRIVGGTSTSGFVFKGDNNESTDADQPTADQLIGRAVLHVPKGGVWLKPLLSPTGLGMIGFLLISGGATAALTRRDVPRGSRKKKVKAMARQDNPWAGVAGALQAAGRLPVPLRVAAGATAAVGLLGVVLGVLGWAGPTVRAQSTAASDTRTMTYSYSAKVPKSPAYDSTTVTSPDPVFRKLTDRVDVRVRYQGPPGSFDLTAELSSGIGWHTTIELLPPKAFTGNGYDATAVLDLSTIDDRAGAAARAIGVANTEVLVTLQARVTTAGAAPFAAPLRLNLTALQMTLPDGAASLVKGGAAATDTLVAREIAMFGTTAAGARLWSVLLLLFALAVAAAIVLLARRGAPPQTRAEIERRYPQLIVPVEPMTSPPGKPVVNVDNFPALVKLAERYGQMILTWSRPDADDFVVRDEGITYRYRTDLENPSGNGTTSETNIDESPPRRRRASGKRVLTGTEDRPTRHRYLP